MSNDDFFEFNLSSEDRKQILQLSLSNDNIFIVLENDSDTKEKYTSLLNMSQLTELSHAFQNLHSLKDALILLTDTIESGNIYLIEQNDCINLKLKVKTEKENFPPFSIKLSLEQEQPKEPQKEEFETLPAKFDYQGNKEAEEKYGTATENTTEYKKPIIESDYKKPILQLEYIEPILQVHYPDGTTKSKMLPPRIQTVDGKTPEINEEQFRYIREQMNQSSQKVDNNQFSQYSTSSVPVPSFNNIFGVITNINNNSNINSNKEINEYQQQTPIQTQNQTKNIFPNDNKSNYSIKTEINKPLYYQSQDIYNKRTVQSRSPPRDKTIEFAPRMINQNQSQNTNIKNFNKSQIVNSNTVNKINQYQNAISKSQIAQEKKPSKPFKGFATVIPLKKIKKPISQSQMVIPQKRPEGNIPFEFTTEQQKERFQTQLRIQQAIVNSKTPKFPSVLPTQIMNTKFEFPQGRDYEEKIISKIKAQDQKWTFDNSTTQQTQSQSLQSQVLPIIYQQDNQLGNNEYFSQQMEKQLKEYNDENINKMNQEENKGEIKDQAEETLGNNEVIEDNEAEQEENPNKEEQEEDIEALYKTEEGYIIFRNGILRGIIHRYSEIDEIISRIQDKLLKGAKFNLLYKAFSDGDKASIFHQKCDGHPISLVLIETAEGIRFGGFTKQSWDGKNLKKKDKDAFVFSIDSGKCFDIKKGEFAVGCYPKFGPVFFGCQIRIYDEFFTKGGTTCLKGLNYKTKKDFELNNGKREFIVKDIEVYGIETIDV